VSRYLFNLCEAMHALGHTVSVAGQRGAWNPPLKRGFVALRRSAARLSHHLEKQPVDLVHAHYRKAAIVGRLLARRFDIPMLFTLHLTGIPMRGFWRWFSDFGDHAHAPSRMARQWLMDRADLDKNRITVIPHGIDPQAFPVADQRQRSESRAALGVADDALVAAYVGRFDDPKNEDWLIDLAIACRLRIPDLHVLLMGQGPHHAGLRRRLEQEALTDRVSILPYGDPLPVYRAADAVLLPSSHEGFSFVTTEAMSVGRPVLRTATAGTVEHIIEGVTGRSVPVDHDAFVRGACEFLEDRRTLARMGQASARHVREHLTFQKQLDRTLALYRSLIRTRRG
jgi:glycosyltransferase involved in cell wall biosynthesis